MSFHFTPPQASLGFPPPTWGAGPRVIRVMGADEPPPIEPPPERKLPTWALVGIVGAVCAVVGVAIYYKYKLTSEIVHKHGVGKALAFEAGTQAIGVVGSRMRR